MGATFQAVCPPPPDIIEVRNLIARCHLGVREQERQARQHVHITLELGTDADVVASNDSLNDGISYSDAARAVVAFVEAETWNTIEKLATSVAKLCLDDFDTSWVRVRVIKTGSLRIAESAGISVTRCSFGH